MDTSDPFDSPPPQKSSQFGWLLAAILLFAAAGAVAYFLWPRAAQVPPPPPPPLASPPPFDAGPVPVVADAPIEPPEEPPSSEPRARPSPAELVRQAASRGSRSALLATWLDASGIIRRIAAAVRLIAQGRSPRSVLGFIQVPGRFSVVDSWDPEARRSGRLPPDLSRDEGERVFVSPEAFERYDEIAKVFTSADAEAWGRGYARVRTHFQKVYEEVAQPGERFDEVLETAIAILVNVEVPEGQPEVVERGAVFLYKDPDLEALSAAEKHLLRMGPDNAQGIQATLRRFARSARLDIAGR